MARLQGRTVIFEWIIMPLSAAGLLITTRWGKDTLVHMIAIPIAALLWRTFVYSNRREKMIPHDKRAANRIRDWNAIGVVSAFFLMAFEAGVAVLVNMRTETLSTWFIFSACTFLPYLGFNALAEWVLPTDRITIKDHSDEDNIAEEWVSSEALPDMMDVHDVKQNNRDYPERG